MSVEVKQSGVPRVAASSYLNTAPLIWSFVYGSRQATIELVTDTAPARSADALRSHEVDAALVPVIEYQRMDGIAIVPGVCVAARERVRSVVLVTDGRDLPEVETVALDTSSRTSVALTKIIFREFFERTPRFTAAAPDVEEMLRVHDAALIIGDPAMRVAANLRVFDLASIWRAQVGLGFVFAVWMIRADKANRAVCDVDFIGARDEGRGHTDDIIDLYEAHLPLTRAELRTYLTENICYELDSAMLEGLRLFYQLAAKHKLIRCARPLQMVER